MQTTTKTSRKYLATPIFGVLMGVVYLVALSVAGNPVSGVFAFAVMVALLDHRDERITAIDLRATAVTALVMIAVVVVAFVVQIARGQSGWPYSMLGVVGGVTYLAAVIVLRIRG